ncbi:ATP-dependent helicase [Corynebacterium bovis]|uniref:ATP-dependent helicase n=1 Tax=Corynebacterium bovis TaxID=36808 RepID=UPI001E472C2F|nr:ATP-dependent helicase [Corynebacterium bovis]
MSTTTPGPTVSPVDLSQRILNQKHPPTSQQAEVIGAPAGPALVVAGAGAGKTETMAARVVWLVANGLVLPEQVLGLTFTRKAASELGRRIRDRLESLAQSSFIRDLPESDPRRTALEAVTPTVATYDSYAGDIVREYGLLYPMEPAGRIITDTERWMIARDVVLGWDGPSAKDHGVGHLISTMLELNDDMDNHLCSIDDVREETRAAIANAGSLPEREGKEGRKGVAGEVGKFIEAQQQRLDLLPLVATFRQRMDELNVMTFGQQMSRAAELVDRHAEIGVAHRRRFRVVMLDEYQDTGHTQRVMLRRLFGGGVDPDLTVTAVGDPMQSIYGFRGATASNLSTFRTDFPVGDEPAPKLQLTTSWRNPPRVLDLANAVSDWSLEWNREDDTNRPVRRLTAGRDIPGEDVRVAWFDRRDREVDWVADQLAAEYREFSDDLATPGHGRDRQFTAAVLVRRNADALPIHDALVARGVPVEMTAGPGLLDVPEVADVYATLRVLVDPDDDIALLRLLTGVRWSIGARDLAALSARARQLSRARTRAEPAGDADGADGTGVDGTGTDVGGAGGPTTTPPRPSPASAPTRPRCSPSGSTRSCAAATSSPWGSPTPSPTCAASRTWGAATPAGGGSRNSPPSSASCAGTASASRCPTSSPTSSR